MADRPRDNTWWIASDGKWYPPSLQPDTAERLVGNGGPSTPASEASTVPWLLTRILSGALVATSGAFAVAAYFGLRYGASLRSASPIPQEQASAEEVFLGWSSFALFALVVTGAVVLMWTFQTSKAFDHRGAPGRRWRGAWTIGSWFVPFASFVLPKLVFNELEKISHVPFAGEDIGESWKDESRSGLGDVWWLLWIIGLFSYQATQVLVSDPAVDADTIAVAASLSGIAHAVLAAAGVALLVVVRRIESDSRS